MSDKIFPKTLPEDVAPQPPLVILSISLIQSILKKTSPSDHKGINGFGLLIAGSANMPGAAILASRAAMKTGIGKVLVHTASKVAEMLPIAIPEAIVHRDNSADFFSDIDLEKLPTTITTIAIGCGLGQDKKTVTGFKNLISEIHSPIILDADALNILAQNKAFLVDLPPYSILTPHQKEFERLTGVAVNDIEKIKLARDFAKKHEIILILKGSPTLIATPNGQLYSNTTGNQGMATAGSGDVLTGILLANLAKGYTPVNAAILSVFIHGLAADMAINSKSESYESMIASDIISNLGQAFLYLHAHHDKQS